MGSAGDAYSAFDSGDANVPGDARGAGGAPRTGDSRGTGGVHVANVLGSVGGAHSAGGSGGAGDVPGAGAGDFAARKKALRRNLLGVLKAMPEAERLASDAQIRRTVAEMPAYQQAMRLFVFVGSGWEVDTRPLIEAALAVGKQVAVPRCLPGASRDMEACLIRSLSELWQVPPLGLWEPAPGTPILAPEKIDLALIPCVACDMSGRRLGRGGGYYDRFLQRSHISSAALCRRALLLEELPVEAHDEKVGMIVTETGLYVPDDKERNTWAP